MARWLITQGDRQFSAQDLAELKKMAREGKVGAADMVQPPGATDWLYASELPELKGFIKASAGGDHDDDETTPRRSFGAPIAAVLAVLALGAGYGMYHFAAQLPEPGELELLGAQGMALSEMLVTAEGVTVRSGPEDGASAAGSVAKDTKVQLVAKRGSWYEITSEGGTKGWVRVDQVVPAYFFADADTREDYNPIYNPDRYVFVKNSSWMQLPDQRRENITIFQFEIQNKAKFEMTDIKLLATIKDKGDKVLETKEIAIEGTIPPFESVMVGTLQPSKEEPDAEPKLMTTKAFELLAAQDEELNMRWSGGVEVQMDSEGFVEANIDLLQVRAIPKKL
jgi:Bacterial SH3 domain